MTLCREWTLVKDLGDFRYAKPLPCRSWLCEHCYEMRRSQLMAQAASGNAVRFLTLTVNPAFGTDPDSRCLALAKAWRNTVKRLRRAYGAEAVEYLAVVEQTKNGEPHLHILLRSPYIPHATISAAMNDFIQSPIVDIRRIRNAREVIRYVAKYLTKAPHKFGTCKRYWSSKNWDLGRELYRKARPESILKWTLIREPLGLILSRWVRENYACRIDHGQTIIGIHTTYEIKTRGSPDYA